MSSNKYSRPHIFIPLYTEAESYKYVGGGGGGKRVKYPVSDPQYHGIRLQRKLDALEEEAASAKVKQQEARLKSGHGFQIQFTSHEDFELIFQSLADARSGVELLNVRHVEHRKVTSATVFVPDGKFVVFQKKIKAYLDRVGNKTLIESIRKIDGPLIESLWTDHVPIPQLSEPPCWWEVWLRGGDDRDEILSDFKEVAKSAGLRIAPGEIKFADRTILNVWGERTQFEERMELFFALIAELRKAKETAEFFDSLAQDQQRAWVDDLLERTHEAGEDAPRVCLLDTGVNRGHPLLEHSMESEDLHTIEPDWGENDHEGHGTEMAGLALYGDLVNLLGSTAQVHLNHRLESVKLIDQNGDNKGRTYGYLTQQAVYLPEIDQPFLERLFSMTITAKDGRDRGQPSAWSGAMDALSCPYGDDPEARLFIVSAGNSSGDQKSYRSYPESNETDGIHDPAQAWNVLTVGAFTELDKIEGQDTSPLSPLAEHGALSPYSTTSLTWHKQWPMKPDVVFEGGNRADDGSFSYDLPSLSLLTTHHLPHERLLTTAWGTSAAASLAAKMGAELIAAYEEYWPETIRGLMVHSAEWTKWMKQKYGPIKNSKTKVAHLIRRCGYGVADMQRARWSADNDLTLIVQDWLQPFKKEDRIKLNEGKWYELPWPKEALQNLGETEVQMRVTLSYFVEPNPSARGYKGRYSYASHALRFAVRRPEESDNDFRKRTNKDARGDEKYESPYENDERWLVGVKNREGGGSLHSDLWSGPATELANLGGVTVYPVSGWWRHLKRMERYEEKVRYALIVSIRAPEIDVDLYNPIMHQVEQLTETELKPTPVQTEIEV